MALSGPAGVNRVDRLMLFKAFNGRGRGREGEGGGGRGGYREEIG